MSTQSERTDAFIEANHHPRYVPLHEAPAIYAARVEALQSHARELAKRLDEIAALSQPIPTERGTLCGGGYVTLEEIKAIMDPMSCA